MERFFDQLLLLLLSLFVLWETNQFTISVIILLVSLCFICMQEVISSKKISTIINIGLLILSIIIPYGICFCPFVYYDLYRKNKNWYPLLTVPIVLYVNAESDYYSPFCLLLFLFSFVLSFYLSEKTGTKQELAFMVNSIRDESTELNLKLTEQNKSILEKQDYEIHLATLSERNRIAREIHDNVGHMLSRTILQVGALMVINKDEKIALQLQSIHDTLDQAMTSIRESVHDLHDDSIDLRKTIRECIKELEEKYTVQLDYDMSANISKEIKYCIIGVTKEALSNIMKHSNATNIHIILREHPGLFQLCIHDNGTVHKENTLSNESLFSYSGMGLQNMKTRVEAINGTFRINTDNGFEIFVSLPKK